MPTEVLQVEGLEDLHTKLDQFEKTVANKICRKALRDGAKVTYSAEQRTLPKQTGATVAALKVRAGKRRKGKASVVVQIAKDSWPHEKWYLAANEFGHRQGNRKLGDKRKWIPGEHGMQYGFEESKGAALAMIVESLKQQIESETAKIGRGQGDSTGGGEQ